MKKVLGFFFPVMSQSCNIFHSRLTFCLSLCNRFMEGGGVNKEEKEAASPTCTKVATSLRDKMEPFFTKKTII